MWSASPVRGRRKERPRGTREIVFLPSSWMLLFAIRLPPSPFGRRETRVFGSARAAIAHTVCWARVVNNRHDDSQNLTRLCFVSLGFYHHRGLRNDDQGSAARVSCGSRVLPFLFSFRGNEKSADRSRCHVDPFRHSVAPACCVSARQPQGT